MKEIQEIVNAKISEMSESGEIQKKVEEGIESAINQAIADQFRNYGNVTKQLNKIFDENIKIDKSQINIPCFTAIMEDVINQKMNEFFKGEAAARFKKMVTDKLTPMKQEMNISEFVGLICKEWKTDEPWEADDLDEYATVEFEERDGSIVGGFNLKMWKQKESGGYSKRANSPDVNLYIDEDGRIGGNHAKDPYYVFNHDAIIFKAYSQNITLFGLDDFEPDEHCDLCLKDTDY